jgi:cobalt-zinc-cadmium resistance protein CzcA
MFRQIIAFSVEQKAIVGFFVFVLIALGIYSMRQIPIDAVPDITNNQVQIVTTSPSLSPQEVERFITYPLELAMANIADVTEIRSISRYGLSVITIVFEDKVPILHARQFVSEVLQQAGSDIPAEYGKPELLPITTGLGEIFQYTLEVSDAYRSVYTPMKLREIQDWIVKRQLSGIRGIVEISSFGGFLKQYEIAIDPYLMRSYKLTCDDIYEAVSRNNQNSGGSYIEKNTKALYIRTEGLLNTIEDIENIAVSVQDGNPVLVKNVATVGLGHAPRFGAMTKNGKGEAVGGITLMLKGANSSKVIDEVNKRIELVKNSLPEGITIEPYLDRAALVKRTTSTITQNLLEGGLIVIFILILLLGNYRSGIIVASVIPLSLLFGFILMHVFGVSANLMSLGAIDFGIVVDGAVIIVESILYHLYQNLSGKTLTQKEMNAAVTKASSKIYHSAAFGVLIILVVFIPIITLTGIEGKNFRPMAQAFSFVIFGAFILSMTYVPMMSALFLRKKIVNKRTFSDKIIRFLKYSYYPVLKFSLRYKRLILLITFLIFLASMISFPFLGGEFVPTLEEGDLAMQMTVPPGSSLSQSIAMSTKAEKILLENFPEVVQVVSKIGTAEVPTDPMAVEDADIMIVLKDKKEWTSAKHREDLIAAMKSKLSVLTVATFEFTQPIQLRFNELMTGTKSDIAVKIYGDDLNELNARARQTEQIISGIHGAADIRVEQIVGLPQLIVRFNRDNIARYGVNIEQLNQVIRTAFAGSQVGSIFENDRKFDLVVRISEKYRKDFDLNSMSVETPEGKIIPLSEVAYVVVQDGPMQISRDNTRRRINVGINVRNRDIQSLVDEIDEKLTAELKLKPGYYLEYGGQFENLEHARRRLAIAVPVSLLLILILLFFTFNSFKYALLIFTAVPLSAVGGIAALWIRGIPFSISAGVGFIALFGVAVLNGIVLISYYRQMQEEGIINLNYIVIKGACTRLRPVLITASTDILGFLPMAVSMSAGGEVQRPLATVVIGGIITSTMLTLVILPILFLMINSKNDSSFRFSRLFKKGVTVVLLTGCMLLPGKIMGQDLNALPLSMDQAVDSAIKNHPYIQNAQLRIDQAKAGKVSAWQFYPTELSYSRGQINSPEIDEYLEINQNFGSLLAHIQRSREANINRQAKESAYEITILEIGAETKSAYLFWQYMHAKALLFGEKMEMFSHMAEIANLRYNAGDISLLEKTLAETQVAEIRNTYLTALDELALAQLKLNQFTMMQGEFYPTKPEPELYMILKSSDTANYNGGRTIEYNLKKYELVRARETVIKSYYFPEFSAGYFNQRIGDIEGLYGWNFTLAFPLWIPKQQAEIKQAGIETDIARNEFEYQIHQLKLTIEMLIFELNKYFKQIRYYSEVALPQAELLLATANLQLDAEEIDYLQYLLSITQAFQIESDYYQALNNYNQTAIQLELYGN